MTDLNYTPHSIIMEDRKKLKISGIKDVDSFDDESITLQSVMGSICIKGSGIKIENFSSESLDITVVASDIYAIVYINDKKEKGGIFSRLLK